MKVRALDLHGVSHEDVEDMVHRFINENWTAEQELHVITGHSLRMKRIVKDVLKMYDVKVEEGDLRNAGYLRVFT
jgi:DNA-nicking Smr family endonuclease